VRPNESVRVCLFNHCNRRVVSRCVVKGREKNAGGRCDKPLCVLVFSCVLPKLVFLCILLGCACFNSSVPSCCVCAPR
jgi:hypothetical protein